MVDLISTAVLQTLQEQQNEKENIYDYEYYDDYYYEYWNERIQNYLNHNTDSNLLNRNYFFNTLDNIEFLISNISRAMGYFSNLFSIYQEKKNVFRIVNDKDPFLSRVDPYEQLIELLESEFNDYPMILTRTNDGILLELPDEQLVVKMLQNYSKSENVKLIINQILQKYKRYIKPGKGRTFVTLDENFIYDPLFKSINFKNKGLKTYRCSNETDLRNWFIDTYLS